VTSGSRPSDSFGDLPSDSTFDERPPSLSAIARPVPMTFDVLAEIAHGPTARVELGRVATPDEHRGRLVAVKRLHAHIADEPMFASMFADEIWMTALIDHPNVVGLVGWGEDREGHYLAVELVEGVSLARLLKTMQEIGEAFSERLVVFIASELAAGLDAAHQLVGPRGDPLLLVHRELTPGNVLVGFDGSVKIADFGLAKAKQRFSRTITGFVKGQPRYMAPEQAQEGPIDARADLFALGVLLFELFSGTHPWPNATDLEVIHAMASRPPQKLLAARPKLDRELALLVDSLLARDPQARPASAAEVRVRLLTWLDVHGYRDDGADALGRFVRRNAQRQIRWFERAIAGEFRGEPRGPQARPSMRLDGAMATGERPRLGGDPRGQVASNPSARRRGRLRSGDAGPVVNAPPPSDSLLELPDVGLPEPSSSEWTEDLPTRVKRPGSSTSTRLPLPRTPARFGAGLPSFVDDESDRTTNVRGDEGDPRWPAAHEAPRAPPDTLVSLGPSDLEGPPTAETAAHPTSSDSNGGLYRLEFGDSTDSDSEPPADGAAASMPRRGAGVGNDSSGRFDRDAARLRSMAPSARDPERSRDLVSERARLLSSANEQRREAERAAREAAHRAVVAQVAEEAAQVALEAMSADAPDQARALLDEAHRLEDVWRRALEPDALERVRSAPLAVAVLQRPMHREPRESPNAVRDGAQDERRLRGSDGAVSSTRVDESLHSVPEAAAVERSTSSALAPTHRADAERVSGSSFGRWYDERVLGLPLPVVLVGVVLFTLLVGLALAR
jgi:serine/threonine protein kinase